MNVVSKSHSSSHRDRTTLLRFSRPTWSSATPRTTSEQRISQVARAISVQIHCSLLRQAISTWPPALRPEAWVLHCTHRLTISMAHRETPLSTSVPFSSTEHLQRGSALNPFRAASITHGTHAPNTRDLHERILALLRPAEHVWREGRDRRAREGHQVRIGDGAV